jgi:hypothetical protein
MSSLALLTISGREDTGTHTSVVRERHPGPETAVSVTASSVNFNGRILLSCIAHELSEFVPILSHTRKRVQLYPAIITYSTFTTLAIVTIFTTSNIFTTYTTVTSFTTTFTAGATFTTFNYCTPTSPPSTASPALPSRISPLTQLP